MPGEFGNGAPPPIDNPQPHQGLQRLLGAEFNDPRIQFLPDTQEKLARYGIREAMPVSELAQKIDGKSRKPIVQELRQELVNKDFAVIADLWVDTIHPTAIAAMGANPEATIRLLRKFRNEMALPAIQVHLAAKLLVERGIQELRGDLPTPEELMTKLEALAQQVLAADKLLEELQQRAQGVQSAPAAPAEKPQWIRESGMMLDGIFGDDGPITDYAMSTVENVSQITGVQDKAAILNDLMHKPFGLRNVEEALADIKDPQRRQSVIAQLDTAPMRAVRPSTGGIIRNPSAFEPFVDEVGEEDPSDKDTTVINRDQLQQHKNGEE